MEEKIIIKTPEQIEWIKKASNLTARTLDMIGDFVKPWISTLELDNICNDFINKNGWKSACINYCGFPKYTCISLNDTICHWIPSSLEILKEWDILNIDITSIINWYFWDASRMFSVWEIPLKTEKLINTTLKALKIWIEQVKPWNYFWNIGYEISKFVEPLGYSIVMDYTGHWVWTKFHEPPYIFHKAKKNSWNIMQEWMIFTIEPMINIWKHQCRILSDKWTVKTIDKSLSAQWEHTILVTKTGYEILTKTNTDFDFKFLK